MPELRSESEPDEDNVEDVGGVVSAEVKAACPRGVMWTESDSKTHPMTSRVDDIDVDKKMGERG